MERPYINQWDRQMIRHFPDLLSSQMNMLRLRVAQLKREMRRDKYLSLLCPLMNKLDKMFKINY